MARPVRIALGSSHQWQIQRAETRLVNNHRAVIVRVSLRDQWEAKLGAFRKDPTRPLVLLNVCTDAEAELAERLRFRLVFLHERNFGAALQVVGRFIENGRKYSEDHIFVGSTAELDSSLETLLAHEAARSRGESTTLGISV